ncbi:MAG: hypothetical protein ASARMPRED_001740 [Alectoria sarmentosa]|nr:MAG: hypothetical protein ASARMPRED_001740 [Alectoria sarmentosa]
MEKKNHANTAKIPHPPRPALSPRGPRPPASSLKSLKPEEVQTGIEDFTTQFQTSQRYESLTSFLEQGQKTRITQCICLGLGHFMSIDKKPQKERKINGGFNNSLHRLAMLSLLLAHLAKGTEIRVYIHDPRFTKQEREYLQSRGYIVPQDDSVFPKMSTSTFLFAPYAPGAPISKALGKNFPALYIGTKPPGGIDVGGVVDMRPLERFERVSFETERLPLFCLGGHCGRESWGNAIVRWLSPGYGEAKASDQLEEEKEEEEEDGKRGSHGAGASGVGKRGKGGGGGGLGDKDGKTDNQGTLASSAGAKGKGKQVVIDWWTYEPPKEGQ